MSYYVSNIIGLRTGGVLSGDTDMEDFKTRVKGIISEMRDTKANPDLPDDPSSCISKELIAHKGSYIVIAGVFNYWTFNKSCEFSKRLSEEFGCEVMHMCWDEVKDEVQCQIFLDGQPLFEKPESPLGRVLRRIM